jgi:type VI secretion system protein ImpJ
MKLSSLSRLSAVHKLALQGVPLQKIGRPPFQHSFGPEVDFYRITEGEEWDHALRDQSLGFYNNPSFEGVKFYLFWRFA